MSYWRTREKGLGGGNESLREEPRKAQGGIGLWVLEYFARNEHFDSAVTFVPLLLFVLLILFFLLLRLHLLPECGFMGSVLSPRHFVCLGEVRDSGAGEGMERDVCMPSL